MQADYLGAINSLKLRLNIAKQLGDQDGQVKVCASLGALYHVTNDVHQSIVYYEKVWSYR